MKNKNLKKENGLMEVIPAKRSNCHKTADQLLIKGLALRTELDVRIKKIYEKKEFGNKEWEDISNQEISLLTEAVEMIKNSSTEDKLVHAKCFELILKFEINRKDYYKIVLKLLSNENVNHQEIGELTKLFHEIKDTQIQKTKVTIDEMKNLSSN